jgi:hypothetical protein
MWKSITRALLVGMIVAVGGVALGSLPASAALPTVNLRAFDPFKSPGGGPFPGGEFNVLIENVGVSDLPPREGNVGGYTVLVSFPSILTPSSNCVVEQTGQCRITVNQGLRIDEVRSTPSVTFSGPILDVSDTSRIRFRVSAPGFQDVDTFDNTTSCFFNDCNDG